jgi:uncharacterized protein (TIGR02300 family)
MLKEVHVAKPELGTKRQCRNCGNRFYDLGRDPILCPKCGTLFEVAASKGPGPAPKEAAEEAEVALDTPAGAELVSLDEADAGAVGAVAEAEEEAEEGAAAEDETFLEEEEEGDDVSALIDGEIEDDEEA